MNDIENQPPHWGDLTDDERAAIIEMARARLFWKNVARRMTWLKGAGTVLLTIGAALTLFRDWIGEIIQWFLVK